MFPGEKKHDYCFQNTAYFHLSIGSSLVSSGLNEFETLINDMAACMKQEKLVVIDNFTLVSISGG